MGKFWSLLFLLVPILGVGLFVVAAAPEQSGLLRDHWLPVDVSEYGHVIDNLFYIILWITGVVFVVTETLLAYFMWRYDGAAHGRPVRFMHGSHTLEVIWTVIPAGVLLFLAIYSMNAWADTKINRPAQPGVVVEVTGRQFEWVFRYPGPDGQFNTPDDLRMVTEMVVPVGEDVLVRLRSDDVLHSFFLPNLRVKQDAVPGMMIPVWFKPVKEGAYDIVCAELCGWGHYKMQGRLRIVPREEYDAWLTEQAVEQNKHQDTPDAEDE